MKRSSRGGAGMTNALQKMRSLSKEIREQTGRPLSAKKDPSQTMNNPSSL